PRQNAVLNDAFDVGETDCATKGVVAFDCGLDGLRPRRGNEFVQVENRLTVGGPADHELKGEDVRLIPATEMAGVGDRGLGVTGNEHRSEEHTSELQSRENLVCRLLLEKKKNE